MKLERRPHTEEGKIGEKESTWKQKRGHGERGKIKRGGIGGWARERERKREKLLKQFLFRNATMKLTYIYAN